MGVEHLQIIPKLSCIITFAGVWKPPSLSISFKIIFLALKESFLNGRESTMEIWLTHWGRVTLVCVGKLTIIGLDNGLSPGRRQAIIWTNAGILLIWPLGTNFTEILIEIHTFLFKKMHLKMSSAKCCSFRLCFNVLNKSYDCAADCYYNQTKQSITIRITIFKKLQCTHVAHNIFTGHQKLDSNFSYRSEIWQIPRQQLCWDACQISERYDHYNIQSWDLEASRDLVVRPPFTWWIEAQDIFLAGGEYNLAICIASPIHIIIKVGILDAQTAPQQKTITEIMNYAYNWTFRGPLY